MTDDDMAQYVAGEIQAKIETAEAGWTVDELSIDVSELRYWRDALQSKPREMSYKACANNGEIFSCELPDGHAGEHMAMLGDKYETMRWHDDG